jgi:hypothetical protein
MFAPREAPQHLPSGPVVGGLSEDGVIEEHEGVRGQDPVVRVSRDGGRGLLARKTRCRGRTGLAGREVLGDVRRRELERDAESGEDLGAAGGGGGEEEASHLPVILRPIPFLTAARSDSSLRSE